MSSEMNYLNIDSDSYEVADAVARAANATNAAAITAEQTARENGDNALSAQIDEVAETVTNSVAPVITGTASGDIASFSDGADGLPLKELIINIDPVQSGEGEPYPAGGGKNLIPYPYATQAGTYSGITVTVNDDGTLVLNGTATASVYFNLAANSASIPMTAGSYVLHKPTPTTVSGINITAVKNASYWSSATNADVPLTLSEDSNISWYIYIASGTNLSNIKVYPMFEKGATASDWQPYSNIRPISGWTGATIRQRNKNLCTALQASPYTYGLTWERNADNSIHVSGTSTNSSAGVSKVGSNFVLPKGSYVLSGCGVSNVYPYLRLRGFPEGSSTASIIIKSGNGSFTLSRDTLCDVGMYVAAHTTTDTTFYPMIRLASDSDAAYVPTTFNGYPISWSDTAGTVYGGTLDVVSGKLTVTMAMVTGSWSKSSGRSHVFYRSDMNNKIFPVGQKSNALCNILPTIQAQTLAGFDAFDYGVRVTDVIYAVNKDCSTAAEFNSWATTNNLQVVYELATPIEYDLDPVTIQTLLGQNNVWADCGSVQNCEYPADTKLYIDNKIAAIVATMSET